MVKLIVVVVELLVLVVFVAVLVYACEGKKNFFFGVFLESFPREQQQNRLLRSRLYCGVLELVDANSKGD
jgi:hypothetical protein